MSGGGFSARPVAPANTGRRRPSAVQGKKGEAHAGGGPNLHFFAFAGRGRLSVGWSEDIATELSSTANFTRRLRAIAVLDVVGYSRLMAAHESRTHARINDLFSSAVYPVVERFAGKAIERAGDGLILLFESSTDAVRCAVDIRRAVEAREAEQSHQTRLRLRIGIHVGDIIIDGDEIAGDDVNIAVRLQGAAEPDSICISQAVKDQLHEPLNIRFVPLGDLNLKNIGRPVRAYLLAQPGEDSGLSRVGAWLRRLRSHNLLLFGLVGAALGAVAWTQGSWVPTRQDQAVAMSVAVAPFADRDARAAPALGAAMAADVARGLAATNWLRVTSPEMVPAGVGDGPSIKAAGRELGVRYLLLGTSWRDNAELGADVKLVDTTSGATVWAKRLVLVDRPGIETEMAQSLVVMLRVAIYAAEAERRRQAGGPAKTAMEHKMLGDLEAGGRFVTLETDRKGREHYERALMIEPGFVPALISVAYTWLTELDLDPQVEHERVLRTLEELSQRAVSVEPDNAPAWQLRAEVLSRAWRWEAARAASDRALALDPGRAFAHGQRAGLLNRLGRPREALAVLDRAANLADQDPGYLLFERCRAQMALGDYAAAIVACRQALAHDEWWLQHAYLVAAYARVGDAVNRDLEKAALLRHAPAFTIARLRQLRLSNLPEFEQQLQAHLLAGLRQAGLAGE